MVFGSCASTVLQFCFWGGMDVNLRRTNEGLLLYCLVIRRLNGGQKYGLDISLALKVNISIYVYMLPKDSLGRSCMETCAEDLCGVSWGLVRPPVRFRFVQSCAKLLCTDFSGVVWGNSLIVNSFNKTQ